MRKTKSLLALLCAVVAAFVLAVPAFAATGSHTITIKSKTDGHTFEAYQVFSGELDTEENTLTNVKWGDGVNGAALLAALKAENSPFASYGEGNPFANAENAADVAKAVEGLTGSAKWVDTFADMVGKNLTTTKSGTLDGPEGEKPYVYTISGVASGYYFIKDQDGSLAGGDNAYTKFILEVVHNVTVEAKADVPPIDKSITGVSGRDDQFSLDNVDAAIGDDVEFTLKSRVPNMDGYNRYKFVVTDTLSKGLLLAGDFGTDDVEITFTNGDQSYTVPKANYTVDVSSVADGETSLKIVFDNFIQYAGSTEDPVRQSYEGWDITIVYHATVDQDAVIGNQGNPNTVHLEYTNDPNYDYQPGNEPGDDEPAGITPDSKVTVFVTGLEIIKTDENNQPLTGAKFKLEGTALNTVMVTRGVFEESESGTYYALKDGTYTQQVPNEDTEDKYLSIETKYQLVNKTEPITWSEEVVYEGYVGSDGIIRFDGLKGLAEGTYTLTETVVPDGYNGIEQIKFTVTFHAPEGDNPAFWTFDVTSGNAEIADKGGQGAALGVYSTTIVNKSGATLPSTGGIGTTIFYAVGATLVIGAGVVLVSRYRANHMK